MNQPNNKPSIDITVTLNYLNEEDYEAVKTDLEPFFQVTGGVVYEFSEVEVAHVVVELLINTVQTVGLDVFSNYLYDAFRTRFLKHRGAHKTFFEFKLKEDHRGNKYTYGSLETDDADILREALATFKDLASPESKYEVFEFDERDRRWKQLKK